MGEREQPICKLVDKVTFEDINTSLRLSALAEEVWSQARPYFEPISVDPMMKPTRVRYLE